MDEKIERFEKVYNNMPMAERKFTIIIIDGEEISWDTAKKEIVEKTKRGAEILEKLASFDII